MLTGFVVVIVIFFGVGIILRTMARYKLLFVAPRANMFALITTFKNESTKLTDGKTGSGNVVDIVHGIPGYRIDRTDPDPMNWKLVPGIEPRGLLNILYGVSYIGWFRYLLKTEMRTFRHGRKNNENTYSDRAQDIESEWIFFSGEHLVTIEDADTAGSYKLDFKVNVIWKIFYPVRGILSVADAIAFLSTEVEGEVNRVSGTHQPEDYLGERISETALPNPDGSTAKTKRRLVKRVVQIRERIVDTIGLWIESAVLVSVSADKKTEETFQLEGDRARMNAAKIADAEADFKKRKLGTDGEADFTERVTLKIANNPNAVRLALGKNLEQSKITTIAGDSLSVILDPRSSQSSNTPAGKKEVKGFTADE